MAEPQTVRFTVYAVPVAQPRPRAFVVGGSARMANVAKGHPIHDFKASVRHAFMDAYDDGAPMQGALTMLMVFVMPRPQAKIWKTRPMPREPYTASMNDWDNLGKGVSDALLGLAYRDDGQLSDVTVSRRIAAGDEMPHVEVEIRETE